MDTASLSPGGVEKLRQAQALLAEVAEEIGLVPKAEEPGWRAQYRRIWTVLEAVQRAGGDLHVDDWRQLGIDHGYKPRGLGGFFNGGDAAPMRSEGDRRILTKQGERFIRQWKPQFGR